MTGSAARPRYRPPFGIPDRAKAGREATIASLLLHILLFALILASPLWISRQIDAVQQRGPQGDGRAGGGGGGNRGTGGPERIRFMAFPTARAEDMKTFPPLLPLPDQPVPEPVKPPEPEPVPTAATVDTAAGAAKAPDVASVEKGAGGGAGRDGTIGSGPGSGGGTGSGTGPGSGSGTGPGTGAGNGDDEVFPPTVIALTILPIPVPSKVRPYKLVAYFEVDTAGNARLLSYNPPGDGGYNRRVKEMLSEIRFRPAVRRNGRPVVDTAVVTAEAPRS
ncbi:MAG: hypothetical protein ACT4OZ_12990 [Gemmatimonadota bacterium]